MAALDTLASAVRAVDLGAARPALAHAVRLLRRAGVVMPDRRVVRVQKLVAAAAVLDGRTLASGADLWPIIYAVPTAEGQALAREALAELLKNAKNEALAAAAAEASGGPLARAARIVEVGDGILAARPDPADTEATEGWTRRVEGVAREIDACFGRDELPEGLKALRGRVAEALGSS
jgi:MoxR-like ATPase